MTTTTKSPPSRWHTHVYNFDIDNYLNHFVPRPRFYILPKPIAHFFGYRSPEEQPKPPLANPVVWLSACMGGFLGIALITSVYRALPLLAGEQVPIVIASFGAAAVLEYNTIESPFAQPRNLILGHSFSALVGVSITRCFQRLPQQEFDQFRWLAGSLSVGMASAVMSITNTLHPPAGGTALLASASREVTVLGWWLVPVVLLASCLMCASALIVNNLTRQWPLYWWTPVDLSRKKGDAHDVENVDRVILHKHASSNYECMKATDIKASQVIKILTSETESEESLSYSTTSATDSGRAREAIGSGLSDSNIDSTELKIIIGPDTILLPDWMMTGESEKEVLEVLKQKLQNRCQISNQDVPRK